MTDIWTEIQQLLWIIIPLALIELAVILIALRDWYKKRDLLDQNKYIWLALILFFNLLGPLIWLYYSSTKILQPSEGVDDWEV
jgi:hypothetical protein